MGLDPIVVVGGGLAAARLATEYRAAGGDASVTILSAEPDPPYNRPPLTKGFLRGEMDRDGPLVRPPDEYEDDVVELRLETAAERIDPDAHKVELAGGERVPYGTLVVATGARPRELPLPGADLVGVHTYRTLRDAEAVIAAAEEAHSAIVIGGSFIGAETAASLRTRGLEVTVVEMGDTLMPQLRCPDLSAELVKLYRSEGVEVLLSTQLEELTGNGRLLTGARTADGRTLEGFLAIVGVGVVPNVELAEDAGAEVDNGIVVDELLGTSAEDVFAAGDVANTPHPRYGRIRVEHWDNAIGQGEAAARSMLGKGEPYTKLPYFFTDQYDLGMEYVGHHGAADELTIRGSLEDANFRAYWTAADGHVTAAMHVNDWDAIDPMRELVEAGGALPEE